VTNDPDRICAWCGEEIPDLRYWAGVGVPLPYHPACFEQMKSQRDGFPKERRVPLPPSLEPMRVRR
jgi:hypothetical protein